MPAPTIARQNTQHRILIPGTAASTAALGPQGQMNFGGAGRKAGKGSAPVPPRLKSQGGAGRETVHARTHRTPDSNRPLAEPEICEPPHKMILEEMDSKAGSSHLCYLQYHLPGSVTNQFRRRCLRTRGGKKAECPKSCQPTKSWPAGQLWFFAGCRAGN